MQCLFQRWCTVFQIFFIFLCSDLLVAGSKTIVRTVAISGNHAFTSSKLSDLLSTKPATEFSPARCARDIQSIAEYYHNEGYYAVDVRLTQKLFSEDSTAVDLTIDIHEGELAKIGAIKLEGNTAFTKDDIVNQFDTQAGKFLDTKILEQDIDALITRYERSGFPFASVSVDNISQMNADSSIKLSITLLINEGKKSHIDEIQVTGNKETSERVIVRETGIRLGETYSHTRVEKIPQRLNRMNIFSKVDEPEFYINKSGAGGLIITVHEGTTNTFDGVVGYVPSVTSGEQGYVTGLVNVSMKNLFGTARKLHVHWQRDDRYSQELAVRYVEPWMFNVPVDLSAAFQQRQQDTTYVRHELELKSDLRLADEFTLGAVFHQENVIPSGSVFASGVSNSRTITAGLELRYDSRDDAYSPTSGVNYRNEYQIGNKKIYAGLSSAQSIFTVQKISFDAEFFAQPFVHQVVTLSLHGRQITSDNIELGDLFRFGGTTSLRGYREKQFLGSRVGWTNAEYRFLLARRSYFFGFFDTGYYFLPGVSSTESFKFGYGIGIRLETSLGNIGVSFAFGEGDSFSQGKIHIGLLNDF